MTDYAGKVSKAKIRKRRAELRRLNRIYTWRDMAREIYDGQVKFQVLARFANDAEYVPTDRAILEALDLLTPINPYRILPRWYKRTPQALAFFNAKREQVRAMSDAAKSQRKIASRTGAA